MSDSIVAAASLWAQPADRVTSASDLVEDMSSLERVLELNQQWHSALPDLRTSAAKFGDLVLPVAVGDGSGGLYAVALVTRPIAANRMRWPLDHVAELRRLAVAPYAPKYAATRSLRIIRTAIRREAPKVCTLLSYQATDVHEGIIYKADNWRRSTSQTLHQSWTDHSSRPARDQNTSPKVRWEYMLRPKCSCVGDVTK